MVGHAHAIPLELVASVLEMAEMAWKALEDRRESRGQSAEEVESVLLRAENLRLRSVLSDNLSLLRTICETPALTKDCPPDLRSRLVSAVESSDFLVKLELLRNGSNHGLPTTGTDVMSFSELGAAKDCEEVSVKLDNEDASWWVLMPQEISPEYLEEVSAIDNEAYVIISEENVVDGISDFVARCILRHPKSKHLTPDELQKAIASAFCHAEYRNWRYIWEAGKIIYALSTWGIVLAGLYTHRETLKAAAKGVVASANFALKKIN